MKKLLGSILPSKGSELDEESLIQEEVVFIHSPFKTGTTTIGGALVMMGYGKEDFGYNQKLNRAHKENILAANEIASKYKTFKRFRKLQGKEVQEMLNDLFQEARGYKIFGDVPFGHLRIHPFIKKLLVPNAKFIWIDREEESWFNSARKWHLAHPDVYPGADKRWKNKPDFEKQKLIKMRDDGFKEFSKLMKDFPDDCLVISLENDANWKPLCDFLKLPEPDEAFPVLNTARS